MSKFGCRHYNPNNNSCFNNNSECHCSNNGCERFDYYGIDDLVEKYEDTFKQNTQLKSDLEDYKTAFKILATRLVRNDVYCERHVTGTNIRFGCSVTKDEAIEFDVEELCQRTLQQAKEQRKEKKQ